MPYLKESDIIKSYHFVVTRYLKILLDEVLKQVWNPFSSQEINLNPMIQAVSLDFAFSLHLMQTICKD